MGTVGRPRILPSKDELARMLEDGMTHQQIADEISRQTGHKIGRATVSAAISRGGLNQRQTRHNEVIPWTVKVEYLRDYPVRMLRLLARRRNGDPLSDHDEARLDSWLERMNADDAVVMYDPDTGFAYGDRCNDCLPDVPVHPIPVRILDDPVY